jgi:LysR substrate binding domain
MKNFHYSKPPLRLSLSGGFVIVSGQSWSCSLSQMLGLPMLHSRRKVQWEDWLQAVGATRKPAENDMFFEDVTILCQCLLEGLGVALVQVRYVEADLAQGWLVTPFPYTLRRPGGYHLVSPSRYPTMTRLFVFASGSWRKYRALIRLKFISSLELRDRKNSLLQSSIHGLCA